MPLGVSPLRTHLPIQRRTVLARLCSLLPLEDPSGIATSKKGIRLCPLPSKQMPVAIRAFYEWNLYLPVVQQP